MPIPAKYRNSIITTLRLSFADQFGQEYCAEAEAILQRSHSSQLRARPSGDLFELKADWNSVKVKRYQ